MVDAVAEFTAPVAIATAVTNLDPDLPRLKTGKEFVADFTPPDYLIDGILQHGYFYTLTAKTGHGKTAWGLLAGICTAAGIKLAGRECTARLLQLSSPAAGSTCTRTFALMCRRAHAKPDFRFSDPENSGIINF